MSEQDIQKYEKMLEEDPGSRAFAPLAEAYRKAGNLDDAIRVAEAGLEIHPGYTGGLVVLGRAFYERKELDRARDVLQKAVSETPESYLGQKFLGKVLMEKGENQAALSALEAAFAQSPDDTEIVELLEKIRPKAQPPETLDFSDTGEENGSEGAGIVTYEQKPTTIDGVELEPLPLKADEETFAFSQIQEENNIPSTEQILEPEGPAEMEMEVIDELGPDAAAFLEEADQVDVTVFSGPGEEIDQGEQTFSVEDLIEVADTEPVQGQPEPTLEEPLEQPIEQVPEIQPSQAAPPGPLGDVASPTGEADEQDVPPATIQPEKVTPSVPVNRMGDLSTAQVEAGGGSPAGTGIPEDSVMPAEDLSDAGMAVHTESPIPSEPDEVTSSNVEERMGEAAVEMLTVDAVETDQNGSYGSGPAPETQPEEKPGMEDNLVPPAQQAPPQPSLTSSDGSASAGDISTETLADLYANQGLVEKAAEIYRQILLERPSDEGIIAKLKSLEESEPPQAFAGAPAASAAQVPEKSAEEADDVLNILENWLQSAERMRRK